MGIEVLEPLVGAWDMRARWPDGTEHGGRAEREWTLGGAFLLERSTLDHPLAPDATSLWRCDAETGALMLHYFDSREVARQLDVSFDGTTLVLERLRPDLSPFDFAQRYTGTLDEGGAVLTGRWEMARDLETFELDFELVYERAG